MCAIQFKKGKSIVIDEKHRKHAIRAFNEYCSLLENLKLGEKIDSQHYAIQIETYRISDIKHGVVTHNPLWSHCVYVLRLGGAGKHDNSISAIANRYDPHGILYIGGHPSGKNTARFNKLVKDSLNAEALYKRDGSAQNDMPNNANHPVANCLTTSLFESGFSIGDCDLDLVCGLPDFDELEFIIGYQEKFHHTPPWNASRKGLSAYKDVD